MTDLFGGGFYRRGQLYSQKQRQNTGHNADDKRIFQNIQQQPAHARLFAVKQLQRYYREHIVHRHNDRNQHDHAAEIRALNELLCQRYAHDDKV